VRAEEPSAVWTPAEHLLAGVSNWLGELTYITAVVNSEEKARKRMTRPEPIIRPGERLPSKVELRPHPRHRRRVGTPIDHASLGGTQIEATAEEVT